MNSRIDEILNFWFEKTTPDQRFKIDEDLDINENEISLVKYIETRDLLSKMENKNEYTPWFEMEWHTLSTTYKKTLRQYTTI